MPVSKSQDEEEYKRLDVRELFRYYWNRRTVVYWCVCAFLAVGLFFAFTSTEEYTSSASIIPEYELQDRVNEVIESFGLLFGMTGSVRENRTPAYLLQLYPHMINSIDFKQKLMHKSFEYSRQDTSVTLYQYFTEMHQPTFLHTIYHSFTEPAVPDTTTAGRGIGIDSGDDNGDALSSTGSVRSEKQSRVDVPILELSADERKVINELSERITAGYQRQTGIVDVSATMPESELAAKVVKLTLETLHEEAGSYKTAKARRYRDFLQEQQRQSGKELEEARRELMAFNSTDSQPLDKSMELQSNYEVSLDHYNTLTRQLKRMELNIQEQSPSFRLLDDITVPGKQVEPKRTLIVFLSVILGFFVAVSWITASFILARGKSSA
nr:GNVR domain-containing protein [Fodinibius roseus]